MSEPFVSEAFVAEVAAVAKAIAEQAEMSDTAYDDMPEADQAFWRACAVAAIMALDRHRKPPEPVCRIKESPTSRHRWRGNHNGEGYWCLDCGAKVTESGDPR